MLSIPHRVPALDRKETGLQVYDEGVQTVKTVGPVVRVSPQLSMVPILDG